MSNQASPGGTRANGQASSMHAFVARLPPPALLLGPLPSMRAAVALNLATPTAPSDAPQAREWLKYATSLPKQTASSYAKLLQPVPTVCFFGEQHNQVNVLRAQLQLLSSLHAVAQQERRPLHVVVEYFSMPEQCFIDGFEAGALTLAGLNNLNSLRGGEGFSVQHMAPLLTLAKELGVKVHAGFPPRMWAKEVRSRERADVMQDVRTWHQEYNARANDTDYKGAFKFKTAASKEDPCVMWRADVAVGAHLWLPRLPQRTLSASAEQNIYSITAAHRSYLSSLFKPDVPPPLPDQVGADAARAAAEQAGPNALAAWERAAASQADQPGFSPHLSALGKGESSGFAPAQAFKDAYFAHVIDDILGEASTTGQAKPIVLAIAGSGHIEYGLGAPARLRAMRAERGVKEEDERHVTIVSKPSDSGLWAAEGVQEEQKANSGWEELDGWERPIADGVVLYEWTGDD